MFDSDSDLLGQLPSKRQKHVVQHIGRNSFGRKDYIHRWFYQGLDESTCRKELSYMVENELLNEYTLWERRVKYYRMGSASLILCGGRNSLRDTTALNRWKRLPQELACYEYTSGLNLSKPRKRLLRGEILQHHRNYPQQVANQWPHIQHENKLKVFRCEHRFARPDAVIKKLAKQLYSYRTNSQVIDGLDMQGKYVFLVAVATEFQKSALYNANDEQQNPIELEVFVCEELLRFITGKRKGDAA